jgi:hypothetical protein
MSDKDSLEFEKVDSFDSNNKANDSIGDDNVDSMTEPTNNETTNFDYSALAGKYILDNNNNFNFSVEEEKLI